MKYYIKGEGANAGKTAEADFRLILWDGEWTDQTEELEINIHDGAEMTLEQYKDIIDYWQSEINSGEIGDWDFGRGEYSLEYTAIDELEWETTQADADEEGTEVRWELYEGTGEFRETDARRKSAEELVDEVISNGGHLIESFGTREDALKALAETTSAIENSSDFYGRLTRVSAHWVEENTYEDGEAADLLNIESGKAVDNRSPDKLIDEIVGDPEGYTDAAAAAYEAYAPGQEYTHEDLLDLSSEYRSAFVDHLKDNATMDDLRRWSADDSEKAQARWKQQVDSYWFE